MLKKVLETDKTDSRSELVIQTHRPLEHGKMPVCQDTDIHKSNPYPAFGEKTK